MRLHCHCRYKAAFSLIELLSVVAIIVFMMAMLAPALSGFGTSGARKAAVTTLMNTFEQARIAALESGQTVYVGFADDNFPVEDMRYAAFLVFRDATDEEKAAGDYVILKPWTRLPKNISIKRVANSLVPLTGGKTDFPGLATLLPSSKSDSSFPALAFTSSGMIEGGGPVPPLFLYEGFFANGQDNFTRGANELFEKISFSRYTGRAQLDISGI